MSKIVAKSINNPTFHELKNGDLAIFFFKEYCPYCREFKPTWNRICKDVATKWDLRNQKRLQAQETKKQEETKKIEAKEIQKPLVKRMDMVKFPAVQKSINFRTVPAICMYKKGKNPVFLTDKVDRSRTNMYKIIENYYKHDKLPAKEDYIQCTDQGVLPDPPGPNLEKYNVETKKDEKMKIDVDPNVDPDVDLENISLEEISLEDLQLQPTAKKETNISKKVVMPTPPIIKKDSRPIRPIRQETASAAAFVQVSNGSKHSNYSNGPTHPIITRESAKYKDELEDLKPHVKDKTPARGPTKAPTPVVNVKEKTPSRDPTKGPTKGPKYVEQNAPVVHVKEEPTSVTHVKQNTTPVKQNNTPVKQNTHVKERHEEIFEKLLAKLLQNKVYF